MRLRMDRMLFNSDVTKLRNDAQNLQPEKIRHWSRDYPVLFKPSNALSCYSLDKG